jgi:hypothetical protein
MTEFRTTGTKRREVMLEFYSIRMKTSLSMKNQDYSVKASPVRNV